MTLMDFGIKLIDPAKYIPVLGGDLFSCEQVVGHWAHVAWLRGPFFSCRQVALGGGWQVVSSK